ncbi:HAD-IIB family hydrolase [Nitrospira moscoviensis]|nr:HAD-IIB family hydrolase [Nitrospira moscoviensis]
MHVIAVAADYDGTLAEGGKVSPSTVSAIERLIASGRAFILVTGRILSDLLAVFPEAGLCSAVVAENGAVLYRPATRERMRLGSPPPEPLVRALADKGVQPLDVGESIIATVRPHEITALEAIRDLGLEHHVVFNRESVMVLPPGVDKATGLRAALAELRLSPHNVVAVGDSENDHALLQAGEWAVAVANAVPTLKDIADQVTAASAGAGTAELIHEVLRDDLAAAPARHRIEMGQAAGGSSVSIPAQGENLLIAGSSGSGKSTLAVGILERLAQRGYQLCVIDPEGDYESFAGAIVFGNAQRAPTVPEILSALERPDAQIVVNLVGMPLQDRPAFFLGLLPRLQEWRARTGRPHRILVDETHHLLSPDRQPAPTVWAPQLTGMIFVTVHPDSVAPSALRAVTVAVALGERPERTLRTFAERAELPFPHTAPVALDAGEAVIWRARSGEPPTVFRMAPSEGDRRRHRRKYAEGELPPDRSFYFRGPDGLLNLRAQNLMLFRQLAAGVDDATWLHHLRQGDYARWMEQAIKDPWLAEAVRRIEGQGSLSADESRRLVAQAIEERYTLPASESTI